MPVFEADRAEDVALAEAAWEAAVACTERTPATPPRAKLVRDLPEGAFSGLSNWGTRDPVVTIRLRPEATPSVIAHEVAHAWVHVGPRGLVEGRTELLTECIQSKRRDRFDDMLERTTDLAAMPDLRTWADYKLEVPALSDAYTGAFRLFRAIRLVVPPERLWGEDVQAWDTVEAALAEAGPRAEPILAALRGGRDAQRGALRDDDRDGLTALYEGLAGTDPTRWDTDGDGWWDGAAMPAPVGAVPLPRDGGVVCLPMVPAGAERVVVEVGGQLGGLDLHAGRKADGNPGVLVSWLPVWADRTGGAWARAEGDALVPNERCAVRPLVTVRALKPPPSGALARLADALAVGLDQARAATGRAPGREVVLVEGDTDYAEFVAGGDYSESRRVVLPPRLLARADAIPQIARELAAFLVLAGLPDAQVGPAAMALARTELGAGATPAALRAFSYEVGPWMAARKRCADGWAALLDGRCPGPATP